MCILVIPASLQSHTGVLFSFDGYVTGQGSCSVKANVWYKVKGEDKVS